MNLEDVETELTDRLRSAEFSDQDIIEKAIRRLARIRGVIDELANDADQLNGSTQERLAQLQDSIAALHTLFETHEATKRTGERPIDLDSFSCVNPECDDFGKSGHGNLRVHDRYGRHRWARLKCSTCGQTFSERRGKPFFRSRLSEATGLSIVQFLASGATLREVAKGMGVDKNTVQGVIDRIRSDPQGYQQHLVDDLGLNPQEAERLQRFINGRGKANEDPPSD